MNLYDRKWVRVTGAVLLVLLALVGAGAGWIAVDLANRPKSPLPSPQEMYATEAEPARSTLIQAMTLFREEKYEEARALWQPLAETGNAEAQFRMGRLYTFGHGVVIDHEKAAHWYRHAVAQDHPIAAYNLGRSYLLGRGVSLDDEMSIKLFRQAAVLGVSEAEFALFVLYSEKSNVPQSQRSALKFLFRAYCRGNRQAQWMVVDNFMIGRYSEKNFVQANQALNRAWEGRSSYIDYFAFVVAKVILMFSEARAPKTETYKHPALNCDLVLG